jgi:hypothetical protein
MLDVLNSDEGLEAHNIAQGTMEVQDGSDDDDRADHTLDMGEDGDEMERLTAEANIDPEEEIVQSAAEMGAVEAVPEVPDNRWCHHCACHGCHVWHVWHG